METARDKVGIVYVPFRDKEHFFEVKESWKKLAYPQESLAIYIVPNIDPDNIIGEIYEFTREARELGLKVTLIEDGKNDGFAGNHNKGIRRAIEDGCEYVYLNNGDLKLEEATISEAVLVAEEHPNAGAVQSLMLYWKKPELINVAGCNMHIAGYGYARYNLQSKKETVLIDGEEVMYASGGATLYRAAALKQVGLLEEGFFMYHEDLELGVRLRIAGWENRVAAKSIAYHDYQFAKNTGTFAWMEAYRYIVTFAYWRVPTLILLLPILLGVELASWVFSITGGWLSSKIKSWKLLLSPKTWFLLIRMRMRAKQLRKVRDKEVIKFTVGEIEAQEQSNWIVEKIANPLLGAYARLLKAIIIW